MTRLISLLMMVPINKTRLTTIVVIVVRMISKALVMPIATSSSSSAVADDSTAPKIAKLWQKYEAGQKVELSETVQALKDYYARPRTTLVPLCGLLQLYGKPYHLRRHFVMEPLFSLPVPRRILLKCARQVSKSTSLSARGVLHSASFDHLRTLFVTPRYEQIRRLSSNYVRPFIKDSVLQSLFVNEACTQAVLQRSFSNHATMYFSFAFLDCDRVRGISADSLVLDEVQDIDYDFVPIIQECLSASDIGLTFYSGTPKTLDNGIQQMWEDSSQAEWVTKCDGCGYWNMASVHADLMKMIGKATVVCARCDKPINPAAGHWYHTAGKENPGFHGYHVPQIIMPMHYENPEKWQELLGKRIGKGNYSEAKFLNEVLGESADQGVKLVTLTDIKEASTLGPNDFNEAVNRFRLCKVRVLAVDWGGGGEDEISHTVASLIGLDPITGKIGCYYTERFHSGYSHTEEARKLLYYFTQAGCNFFAHDYGGSGGVRETLMIQAGLPMDRIVGFMYTRAAARDHMIAYKKPAEGEARGYWSLDKARSLVLQAACLKSGAILLPEFESSKDVTRDLLALVEDKHDLKTGADVYLIGRSAKMSDDFAHSLNFGCCAIWHTEQNYPDLSLLKEIKLSEAQLNIANPPNAFRELGRE